MNSTRKNAKFIASVKYLPYLLVHPFDGFYEAKFRGKGSAILATALLCLYGITQIAAAQYTGFITNDLHPYGIESGELFLSGVLPVCLFFMANWSTATLMNGNGKLRDVYMVTCYSLAPLILFGLTAVIVSNALIIEETPILAAFSAIGVIWFAFLLFSGLCVVHEYTAAKNIAALLATVVAAVIILFLAVLYLTLLDKVKGFFEVIYIELTKRW